MINAKIFRKNNTIWGYEISGHSGYSEAGSDIVCSAVSTLALTTALGIKDILKININLKKDDNRGYLKLVVQDNERVGECQVLFETMVAGLREIQCDFKKNLKLEENYEIF